MESSANKLKRKGRLFKSIEGLSVFYESNIKAWFSTEILGSQWLSSNFKGAHVTFDRLVSEISFYV